MPHEIEALVNWQSISLGRIFFVGETEVVEELNDELERSERIGLIKITEVKEPKKAKAEPVPKGEVKAEAEPSAKEVEVPKGMCPVCKEGPFARLKSHVMQKDDDAHKAYLVELEGSTEKSEEEE